MSAKRKVATIATPVVKPSAKTRSKTQIDETRTVVATGLSSKDEPIEILSDSDHEDEDKAKADQEEVDQEDQSAEHQTKTTEDGEDVEMGGGDADDTEPAAPTFGELLRGSATVDVSASLAAQTSGGASSSSAARLEAQQQRNAGLINTNSFATLLNQALRTGDNLLLETCLEETNIKAVENTIARLDSSLALELLSKLAARLHRRPGRSLTLMQWMKFTMIAHGGALVNRPDLTARLGELSRVLEERARGLPALLALRGKLEMLDAQLKFRKAVKQASSNRDRITGEDESEEEEEDEGEPQVVYVEGQETALPKGLLTNGVKAVMDDEDDFPIGDDVVADSDDEEDDDDFEGDEQEEELADAESLDEDEVDHDDVDDEEDDSEGEEAGPPAKIQRTLRPRK
ncbi:Dip2/Utp12 family-domain-containing protein [Podospora australis]|uniref:Dip2/Utp12 family-domain-containing protein n=1 Tax=Podospora australis TaxID=1536484 RepID=A0AAN7ABW8_9PEZI|nr:Dip2/Utp12 family-domain-containing protein [Podospora australis]